MRDKVFILPFSSSGRTWTTVVAYDNNNDVIRFYSIMSRKAPNSRLPQIAEFVIRANWGLPIGNFELDLSDGEIRYKVSFDAEQVGDLGTCLRNMMRVNLSTFERVCAVHDHCPHFGFLSTMTALFTR